MGLFDRFRRDRAKPASQTPSSKTAAELTEFMGTREGVEAYVEPPTSVFAMTLCLVAADGEFLRKPVKDERQAKNLCADHGVPLYDARIVGYPKRMREYQEGQRHRSIGLDELPPLEVTDESEPPEA